MIVIDMGIPTSCCECSMCHPKGKDEPWNFVCFQGMMDINLDEWDTQRHPKCPIKCDIEDIKNDIKEDIRLGYLIPGGDINTGLNMALKSIDRNIGICKE